MYQVWIDVAVEMCEGLDRCGCYLLFIPKPHRYADDPVSLDSAFTPILLALQATSLKLGAEKEELEEEVTTASERLANGLPPTEDCESEWYRMERTRMVASELSQQRQEDRQVRMRRNVDPLEKLGR